MICGEHRNVVDRERSPKLGQTAIEGLKRRGVSGDIPR